MSVTAAVLLKYLIELIVVLIPVGTLFAKFIGWRKSIEMQVSQIWKELGRIDGRNEDNGQVIRKIENQLTEISTKLDLLIGGKLEVTKKDSK